MLHLIDRRPTAAARARSTASASCAATRRRSSDAVKKMVGERRIADMEQRRRSARAAARTSPSRPSASAAAATANSCFRATASTSPATAFRGPRRRRRRRAATATKAARAAGRASCSRCRARSSCRSSSTTSSCPISCAPSSGAPSSARASAPGYTKTGAPANLSRRAHAAQALARRIALAGGLAPRDCDALERELRDGGRGRACRTGGATLHAELERLERAAQRAAVPRRARPALSQSRLRAGADRAGGDVLPDGRVGVDGRGQEGPRQALLHAALSLPDAQVRRGRPGLHPPHRRRRGSRRGHVLPRPALPAAPSSARRWSSRTRIRARAVRPAAGTSTRRRPPTATRSAPIRRAARASCASGCCPRRATSRTWSSPPAEHAGALVAACGPSTSASPRRAATSRCASATRRDQIYPVFRDLFRKESAMTGRICRTAPDWDFDAARALRRRDRATSPPSSDSTPTRTRSRSSRPSRCSTRMRRAGCRSAIRTGRTARSSSATSRPTGAACRGSPTRS